ncbi:uncharacterized protein BO80DRAFT_477256 [Aspergillus ibericus CBS 121593]|uniref:Integral membrane protein n=1 Tax=Aspergillus ibericus CBS 121593 TaxID=1448316 RepID=A0A395H0K4_9EURO|nr:hypothetical protein BO80DRAFT_477256 [Aspergillus ibericus CBS 121593]RAK99823.1 hypothetical protein BO80DRAFT_477256 [Aspergillus ibericus CBS 121593]
MSLLPFSLFIYLYTTGSLFYDTIHYILHQGTNSPWRLLRFLSTCHQYHHFHYNQSLNFNDRYLKRNIFIALPLELLCQMLGSVVGRIIAQPYLHPTNIPILNQCLSLTLLIQITRTLLVMTMSGRDSNHIITFDTVPKDTNWVFVGPHFHALHHIHPDRYMGSMIKLVDWVAGTAYSFRHKRVILTGGTGAFGSALEKQLLCEGVRGITKLRYGRDWTHGDFTRVGCILREADILILAHGSKDVDAMAANCHSSIQLIETFLEEKEKYKTRGKKPTPMPEIWYIGSEIELHPAWGIPELQRYSASKRAFVPYARGLYQNPKVLYRHIVPAAFQSSMGKAIVSADWAASVTMWWIHRGAWYVPVTYTGLAVVNYFKFRFGRGC